MPNWPLDSSDDPAAHYLLEIMVLATERLQSDVCAKAAECYRHPRTKTTGTPTWSHPDHKTYVSNARAYAQLAWNGTDPALNWQNCIDELEHGGGGGPAARASLASSTVKLPGTAARGSGRRKAGAKKGKKPKRKKKKKKKKA